MAQLKDLIVNGPSRFIGDVCATTFTGNLAGNANTATNATNAGMIAGLSVHSGRNNEANKIVRTDGNGYLQVGYINSSSGHEKNASNPTYVWGSNSSDSYLRSYQTSSLSVNYATLSGSCSGNAATATNADLLDGYHKNDIIRKTTEPTSVISLNNVVTEGIDFTSWGYAHSANINNQPGGDGASSAACVVSFGTDFPFQIYSDYNNTSLLYYRSYYSNIGWKAWRQFAFLDSNVASASKWKTARTITLTGSVTGSVSIDGSANVTLATTTNHTHTFASLNEKPTTISGYGITDALTSKFITYKEDFQHYVILLCRIGTNTTNYHHTINGTFWSTRTGGTRYQAAYINVHCSDWTSNHNGYYGFTPFGLGTMCRLVTCTYQSSQYLAITFEGAQAISIYFDGSYSNILFTPILYYTTKGSVIENSEIYNSITEVTYDKIPLISSAETALTSSNYNSYAPKLDGTGATGTWGINISGNAGSANALNLEAIGDLNSVTDNRAFYSYFQALNRPSSNYATGILLKHPELGHKYQLVFDANGGLFTRHYASSWQPWKTIAFTDSNISGNAATATNADKLDGVHYQNILERQCSGSGSSGTATGWFRIAETLINNGGGVTFLLAIQRTFHYTNNESYLFSISVSFGGGISITQLSGYANIRLITKIRVDWANSQIAYIDLYIDTSYTNNNYYWYTVGCAKSYTTWTANPTLVGNAYEFTTVQGCKSDRGFTGYLTGNATSSSKWSTARTITLTGSVTGSVSIDGSGDVSLATTTNHTHSYLPLAGGTVTGQLFLTGLAEGASNVTDNTEILTSYATDNGFADSNGAVYRRDAIHLYNYIKSKLDSVYLPLSGGTMTGNIATKSFKSGTDSLGLYIEAKSNVGARIQYNKSTTDMDYDTLLLKNGVISWNNNTLLHSGNYNSYAPKLDGTGANGTWGINISGKANIANNLLFIENIPANTRGELSEDYRLYTGLWSKKDLGYASQYGQFIDLSGGATWYHRLAFNTTGVIEHFQGINTTTLTKVGDLAYTSSNVASATKLQNARTIWGHNFDGTGNVSGALSGVTTINSTLYIDLSGNIGIGTASPSYKLYVNGNGYFTENIITESDFKSLGDAIIDGYVGIGTQKPAYRLDVNGTISCTKLLQTSDIKYKTNIKQIEYEEALKIIENLNPVTWDWNENTVEIGSSSGFVAQEAEEFIPNAISRDNENNLSLDYTQLHSYEIKVIQEQQKEIIKLKEKLKILEKLIS